MDYLGYIDEVTRYYVAGWVADRDDWSKSLDIDILVKGHAQFVCKADSFRDKLDELHPQATGRYAFRFYFAIPLSMYDDHEISVRVRGSTYFLIQQQPKIDAISADPDVSKYRPGGPVLLSTMGRTGSTAVMAAMAQHPNIVVAGTRPYETELGCYYAYALRTLAAHGDHQKSLRTDNITATENQFHIGFNPYFEHGFSSVFKDPHSLQKFLTERLPRRIGKAFREVILDYYEEVAKDQLIENPIYFAEKSLPESDSRLGIRFMFPGTREIALVRDPRDVVCSATSSNGRSFDQTLEDTLAAAWQMKAILDEGRSSVMFMRYEEFILERDKAVAALFRFLGLASVALDQQSMGELFGSHATSVSPQVSIGRWKNDLTLSQQKKCEVFDPLLVQFGYSVT